jgi:prevent-host-death family protein
MNQNSLFQTPNVKSVPASQAKDNFGLLIDDAQRAPVRIEKHGRPVAFVLSAVDFEALTAGQPFGAEGREV